MPRKTIRACGYPRVSDPSLKDSKTLESQADEIIKYCREHGYDLDPSHIYSEAHTAYMLSYRERPKLRQLLQAAKNREFDVVVVNEYSRLSRRQIEQAVIIDILEGYGVKVESCTEKFEDSAIGHFMRSVYAFLSEIEREKIVERTTRGKWKRVKCGNLLGQGKPTYGYKWADNEDYTHAYYVINEDVFYTDAQGTQWSESKVVMFIFTMADNGMSLRKIRFTLTQLGIPTRRNKEVWKNATIHQILRNRNYIGEARAYKWKRMDGKKYMVERDNDEVVVLPDGVIPALIDEALFDRVQQRLEWNKQHASRNNRDPQELLRCGLAKCGLCGATMRVQHLAVQTSQYKCHKSTGIAAKDHVVTLTVTIADKAAWEFAVEHIKDTSLIQSRIEALRSQNMSPEDAERIEAKLEEVRVRMTNLVKMGMGAEDEDVLAAIQKELHMLEKEKKGLQAMLADVAEDEETAAKIEGEIRKFEEWVEKVRPLLADPSYNPSYEEKRLALLILGVRATVWPVGSYEHRCKLELAPPSIMEALLCRTNGTVST